MLQIGDQLSKVEQTDLDDMGQVLAFPSRPKLETVKTKKGTSPNKGHEATGRTREHLTPAEMDRLLEKAKRSGQPGKAHRNHCLVLTMYRHGLRVGEAASLKWSDVDLDAGNMFVRRSKGSKPSTQPIAGDEIRALRKLQRESKSSPYVFGAIAPVAISKMIQRLGDDLFGFPIHAHMLRHSTGYYLANKGIDTRTIQDYLGHCNIQHTTRYTELAPGKFRNLWD